MNGGCRVFVDVQPSNSLLKSGAEANSCACVFCQVSPDQSFEEILGVSDTFIPAANVWVGEYPYLDKVRVGRASRGIAVGILSGFPQ